MINYESPCYFQTDFFPLSMKNILTKVFYSDKASDIFKNQIFNV